MFMSIASLDEDENEDKHSCCVSFLETGSYEKTYKILFKKIVILCKEHLVTLTFCWLIIFAFFSLFIFYTLQEPIKRKEISKF